MKKTVSILSVLAITLVFSGTTFAQVSSTVAASATVEQEITLTKNSDIAFGTVQQGTTPTLDPNGSNSSVGSSANIGDIDISASSSTSIVISWNSDAVLSDGTNSLSLSEDVDGRGDGTDDASGATDLSSGDSVTTDGSGKYYLYLGGSITVGSSQTTGTYNTSNSGGKPLTVEVNYQ